MLVNAQGQYVINRSPVPFKSVEQLADELRRAGGALKDPVVVISADAAATHQAVVRVMEAARVAGLSQITFTTQSNKVVRHWYRRGALAWLLWPASLAFALLVLVRRLLYRIGILRSVHPGIPVIVVGNLSVGGSGKTPLVLWIAEFLQGARLVARRSSRAAMAARGGAPRGRHDCLGAATRSATSRSCSRGAAAARCGSAPSASKVVAALRAQHPEVDVVVLRRWPAALPLAARPRNRGGRFARLRQRVAAARRTVARAAAAVAHRRRRGISSGPRPRNGERDAFEMRLEGEVAAPHERRARKAAAASAWPARRSTRSRASATRTASSSTWASSA